MILKAAIAKEICGLWKENHTEISNCLIAIAMAISFAKISFNCYCMKVEDMFSHSNQFEFKYHVPGMSNKSLNVFLTKYAYFCEIFSCCYHSNKFHFLDILYMLPN